MTKHRENTDPNVGLEKVNPFPDMQPPMELYKYDGEKDDYWFAAICSRHRTSEGNEDCPRCMVGSYEPNKPT